MTQLVGSDPSPESNTHRTVTEDSDTPNNRDTALPPPSEQDISDIVTYIGKASASTGQENEVAGEAGDRHEHATSYWDAGAMAPLNARSAAAIARLRAYRPPPFPVWDRLPASRRAAVLLLLYADRRGDLRVIITMRATSLRNFSGHAALPGGKADSVHETPYQIARREAWEEIGLPLDARLPKPFRIEPLCELPCNMAQTHLVVRPCVAFLHIDRDASSSSSSSSSAATTTTTTAAAAAAAAAASATQQNNKSKSSNDDDDDDGGGDMSIIPRLDAKEVAAVFTAPFHNFLLTTDEPRPERTRRPLPPGHWYDGRWLSFRDQAWRVHNFHVPVDGQKVSKPQQSPQQEEKTSPEEEPQTRGENGTTAAQEELARKLAEEEKETGRYKVWGMTAHILLDAARIAYDEEPEMEHNPHLGDERLIAEAEVEGLLFDKKRGAEGGEEGEGKGKGKGKTEPVKM
ncbi:hypothetical protein SODALDRAFT_335099 [Sodiomyces alkalinus F11]|uniref:Nudix hydrolase domain-containing protein n=1 Tax=Sodiomyces alkalinus (strain CBS 110278 / VKM F-3762 / F11) TaxID=1314773 RepID=A0A3N2PR00_SODAK|nr:hypothetical protein SODALDRAFT_335099 [Sodiomyces alkalinus F11]ROT36884.1 hypothetical protein SODALDRAFT_335099 [Sodiomyces alkalinus F11]